MPSALSICVLFISFMQSVNGAHFLNTISILLFPPPAAYAAIVTVLPTSVYASLQSHQVDFNIEVLNLTWLLVLYVPRASSFISTQFFVLNLVG